MNKSDDSFDVVNYSLRPNKSIARKLMFASLVDLNRAMPISGYRYIGMGSIWFIDFIAVHRMLGLSELLSIEANEKAYRRALFNQPFACVDVRHGYTSDILPELQLDERPSIIWLDHDTKLDGPALKDIGIVAENCCADTILIVTLNADAQDYKKAAGTEEAEELLTWLSGHIGDNAPKKLTNNELDRDSFSQVVRATLERRFARALRERAENLKFLKLFDFAYRDGPPMATVGGLIARPDRIAKVRTFMKKSNWSGLQKMEIRTPHLTPKEKATLDRYFPRNAPLLAQDLAERGIPLDQAKIDSYALHYRHYPLFAELS